MKTKEGVVSNKKEVEIAQFSLAPPTYAAVAYSL